MARKKAEKVETKEEPKAEPSEVKVETKEEVVPQSNASPHYKHRLDALNEIAKSNREERDAALAETEPSVEEDVAAANAASQEEETPEPKPEQQQAEPEVPKRKFIVDGREVELTDDEITAHVQKSATADNRLREAARLFQEAKKATPTPTDASRSLPTQDKPASAGPLPASSADAGQAEEVFGKISKALLYGDEEQVTSALKDLTRITGRQSNLPTQETEDPRRVALETYTFLQAKQLLDEPPERGGFSDILSDPVLRSHFERRENELRDAGDQRPYRELYTAIGTEVRKWRDDFLAKHTPKTGLENRDELKRQTGVVRGAGMKVPAPVVEQPKTHEQKLEQMRRSRGLN